MSYITMQNTDKHTPAPWFIKEGAIYNEEGATLARVPYTIGDEQDIANAHLIAAAPDLLSECERTQSELISALNDPSHITPDMLRRWLKGVEEVLKRARGVW